MKLALQIYLSIGLVMLFGRIGYDGIMHIRKVGLQLAAARGVKLLPALLVLAAGVMYLLAGAVLCWPFTLRRVAIKLAAVHGDKVWFAAALVTLIFSTGILLSFVLQGWSK